MVVKVKIIFIVLMLLLTSGCIVKHQSFIFYFDDTGNAVENMRICDQLSKEFCDMKKNCVGYTLGEIICDGGKCYC